MYIQLKELFIYRQYKEHPIYYFFDKKTYKIADLDFYEENKNKDPYERFIPMFQIDEDEIAYDFVSKLNNKKLMRDYQNRKVCSDAFIEDYGLDRSWWEFYVNTTFQIASDWCRENHISFKDTEKIV